MNKLPLNTRVQIINLLVEGNSIRSITRITGCSKNTVSKLQVEIGKACQRFHDDTVKGLSSKRIQADEIWSFVYAKEKNMPEEKEGGDVWTWTGLDADSKLMVSWYVGNRDAQSAHYFIQDMASRLNNRIQLTTDGLKVYIEAVENAFGNDIDYAQLVKVYGENTREDRRRYSPAAYQGAEKKRIAGTPDKKHVSTSHVERQNLTMRMHMRRFTRLTNAFSKKLENHACAIALHFVHYNFCRIHSSLRVTPAMEAGLTDEIMTIEQLIALIDFYSQDEN